MDATEIMFKELTEAFGPSGFEGNISVIMERYLKSFCDISYDRLGSMIAKKTSKESSPRIMLAGHMDEVGFMVKQITKNGFIKFLPLGGWWSHTILNQRVIIKTRKGYIMGVVGSKAPHKLTPAERNKLIPLESMYIDVGGVEDYKVDEELGIRPGDPIVPYGPFEIMGNPKVYAAKAWDNRIGCAMIIDTLKGLREDEHPNTVYGVGTVQEEVGLRGAGTSAWAIEPDVAFALDVNTTTDEPGYEKEEAVEKFGNGPSIMALDSSMVPNRKLFELAIETAEEIKIPYHISSLMGGGYDTGRIHLSRKGVPSLSIAIPTRYIHSHVGCLHRDDYDNSVKLLIALIKKLDAETVANLV